MIKNIKMDRIRNEQKNIRDRSASRFGNQLALMRQTPKPNPATKIEEPHLAPSSPPQILHKEIFNNNMATVEVTVRATPQRITSQSNLMLNDKREPWRKVIVDKGDEGLHGSFSKFDPLRTLHFLSKELELKLQLLCPDDPNLQQIVNDMQHAMERLPPDVISQLQENILKEPSGDLKFINIVKKRENINQMVQTMISGENNSKQLQEKLEESIKKLEADVKDKDSTFSQLRKQKDEIEAQLTAEKETVKSLKKELEECVSEKRERAEKQVEVLRSECDNLQAQVKELQKQLNLQTATVSQDIKTFIEELRNKHIATQKENTDIRNELAQIKLNKDKLNMLLECKDKQLEELRAELHNIQSFICSQVHQFKSKTSITPSSSISSISKIWNTSTIKSEKSKSKQEIYLSNETISKILRKYNNVHSVDSELSTTFTEDDVNKETPKCKKNYSQDRKISKDRIMSSNTTITTHYKMKEKYSSMRAVFSEMKRQAYVDSNLTLAECQPFHDVSSINSQFSA